MGAGGRKYMIPEGKCCVCDRKRQCHHRCCPGEQGWGPDQDCGMGPRRGDSLERFKGKEGLGLPMAGR